ncbi:MAG TPA: hemolysin III family protein [Gaiellaceae bacterium]|nr:hemolysin III family protein [Gaiellaceae bacterium]
MAFSEPDWLVAARRRPRLRGVIHQYAFFVSLVLGVALVAGADGGRARTGAAVFAACVSAMLGISALYHRVVWAPAPRRWMRRLDHAAIFLLIAGTYTPFGLVTLEGAWRIAVLSIVWSGAAAALILKVAWVDAPRWVAAVIAVALGWIGVVVLPQLHADAGSVGLALLAVGGLLYTAGAVVYARRRPDPVPHVFGYHEVFHVLVVAAAACQYGSVAFVVL